MGNAASTTAWPPSGSRYIPSTSPPSAFTVSAMRRASSGGWAISATVRPLLLAACRFRGGLRFLVEAAAGVFAAIDGRIARDEGFSPLRSPRGVRRPALPAPGRGPATISLVVGALASRLTLVDRPFNRSTAFFATGQDRASTVGLTEHTADRTIVS